jgi:signal peptidase I
MNEVRMTGKVLSIYRDNRTDALITKVAVMHDHFIGNGNETMRVESKFTTVMTNEDFINRVYAQPGDKVMLTGYVKQDFNKSDHDKNMIYATKIEVVA